MRERGRDQVAFLFILELFLFLVLQVFQADLFQKMNLKPDVSKKKFTKAI